MILYVRFKIQDLMFYDICYYEMCGLGIRVQI